MKTGKALSVTVGATWTNTNCVLVAKDAAHSRFRFYHLLDAVEALPMEAEGLFEQNLVLHRPLIWERREVRQVSQRLFDVVFVPEEHSQRLHARTHAHTHWVAFQDMFQAQNEG